MAKLGIRPLGDKVIIKRVDAEDVTTGGIVLPDSAKEKPKRGLIKAIGDGKLLDSGERSQLQVKKNDEMLFTSYLGTEAQVGGDECGLMDLGERIAVLGS